MIERDFYLKSIDAMIVKAKEENELAFVSILYTLKGSIIAQDTKTMADYVIHYTQNFIDKINKIKQN